MQQTQTSRRSSPSTSLLSALFPNQSLASEARVLSACQSNKTSQKTRNSRLQPPILRPEINLLGCSLFLMSSINKNLCSAPKAYNALHPNLLPCFRACLVPSSGIDHLGCSSSQCLSIYENQKLTPNSKLATFFTPNFPSSLLASQSLTMMYFSMFASQSTITLCTELKTPHFLHLNLLPSFSNHLLATLLFPMFVNPPTPYTRRGKKKANLSLPNLLPSVFSCFVPTQLLATMLFPKTFAPYANFTTSSTPSSSFPSSCLGIT